MRTASGFTSAGPAGASASKRVPWAQVVIFSLLSYAIAWAVWSPLWPAMRESLRTGTTPTAFAAGGAVMLGMFAPAIAAIIMRLFVSREGFRGSIGIRRSWRYYAIAILGPVAFVTALVGVVAATGLGEFNPGGDLVRIYGLLLLVGVPIGAILAFGEEFGWRGYLLPRLLPLGERKASVIVGLIWAAWHLPVLLAGLNYPGENVLLIVGVFTLSAVVLSEVHTRMFVASGGSVLVVAFLHGSLNTFSDRFTDPAHLSGNPLLVSGGGLLGIGIMAAVVAIAYAVKERTSRATLVATSSIGDNDTPGPILPALLGSGQGPNAVT
jgi:uncharacterized protein